MRTPTPRAGPASRPTYTDINADADAGTVAKLRLVDGFGVTSVNELRVERRD